MSTRKIYFVFTEIHNLGCRYAASSFWFDIFLNYLRLDIINLRHKRRSHLNNILNPSGQESQTICSINIDLKVSP